MPLINFNGINALKWGAADLQAVYLGLTNVWATSGEVPSVVSIATSASGLSIYVTYDRNIDPTSVPAPGDMTVTQANWSGTVTDIVVVGSIVVIELDTPLLAIPDLSEGTDWVITADIPSSPWLVATGNTAVGTWDAVVQCDDAQAPHDIGAHVTAFDDADRSIDFGSFTGLTTITVSGSFYKMNPSGDATAPDWRTIVSANSKTPQDVPNFKGTVNLTDANLDGMWLADGENSLNDVFRNCGSLTNVSMLNLRQDNPTTFSASSTFYLDNDLLTFDISLNGGQITFHQCSQFMRNAGRDQPTPNPGIKLSGIKLVLTGSASAMFRGCNIPAEEMGRVLKTADISGLTNDSHLDALMNGSYESLTTEDYDELLIAWEAQVAANAGLQGAYNPDFNNSTYTAGGAAEAARNSLISYGWSIIDGGAA